MSTTSSDGTVTVTFEIITPELAEQYLTHNTANRNLSELVVDCYVRDMKDTRWGVINNGIAFTPDGTLLDGQHRLAAIARSGIAQEVAVFRGVSPLDRAAIDTGRKRTVNDELKMRGVPNSSLSSSVVRVLMFWEIGEMGTRRVRFANTEVADWYDNHPDVTESVVATAAVRREINLPGSVAGAAHYRFNQVDPELCALFFERLAHGNGLSTGDPLLTLRNRIIKERTRGQSYTEQAYLLWMLVRAWNAMRSGERLTRMVVPDNYSGKHFPNPQ